MARLPITRCRRVARGFSLIELLVSITIGLVVVIAAMSAYLGSADASKAADAQARMNEDAQAALNLLTQQLRLAASNPVNAGRADAFRHNPVFDTTDPLLTGFVGVYNFRFDLGNVPVYFDDLVLSTENVVPTRTTTLG